MSLLRVTARGTAVRKVLGNSPARRDPSNNSRTNLRKDSAFGPRTSYGPEISVNSFSSKVIAAIKLTRTVMEHIPEKNRLNGINQA